MSAASFRHAGAVRRRVAAILAFVLAVSVSPFAPAASAATWLVEQTDYPGEPGSIVTRAGDGLVPTVRWRGETRHDTARLIAADDSPFRAPFETSTVLIARGDLFPDALAGSYRAGQTDSPILLTQSDQITGQTLEALEELDPESIVLLGGTAAISAAVEDELMATYGDDNVDRIGGAERYETAVLLAASGGDPETDTAIVASGENFPDALVSGALAVSEGFPMLLTRPESLTAVTAEALNDLGIDNVLLAGGLEAVSQDVEDAIADLGIDVERVRELGAGRSGTAAAFARLAVERYGYTDDHLQLATGADFPDALTVAPHAGLEEAPILITNASGVVDAELQAYLDETVSCDFSALHIAGGLLAVPTDVEDTARAALTTGPCAVQLAPESATNLVGETHTVVAFVTNSADAPVANETVTVVAMPASDPSTATPTPESQTMLTDESGTAFADITSATPGEAAIVACVTGPEGGDRCSEPVTKTWLAADFLATGLAGPRGVDIGRDGAAYVTESGFGGDECVTTTVEGPEGEEEVEFCFGLSGAVTRADDDGQEQFVTGLPSYVGPFGPTGPSDVSFGPAGVAYVIVGLGAPAPLRDQFAQEAPAAADLGKLFRVALDGTVTVVADLAQWEQDNNPDGASDFGPVDSDSNPYAVFRTADGYTVVADAGGNTLLRVDDTGEVSLVALFPEAEIEIPDEEPQSMQAVPTGITEGADGAFYVSELAGRIWRVDPAEANADGLVEDPEIVFDGTFFAVDLDFDADGNLYVLQPFNVFAGEEAPSDGIITRLSAGGGGGFTGSATLSNSGLSFPLGIAVDDDGELIVSNCGVCPSGQLVRLEDPVFVEAAGKVLRDAAGRAPSAAAFGRIERLLGRQR
ncbi:hypothetical protein BH23ACT7_BH23ACT7_27050 [soil metagenome]